MTTTNMVLDRIKSQQNVNSDYAISKLLSVTRQAISKYRNKGHQFDDSVAIRAAKLAQMNPAKIIAKLHVEKETGTELAEVWKQIERALELSENDTKQ